MEIKQMNVALTEQEWSAVISIIAHSHPLVMKISQQLAMQSPPPRGNGPLEMQEVPAKSQ